MDQSAINLFIQGFSAFAGAFFAFLFLRISEFLTKLYQREVKHYNTLVIIQTQLNEIGGIIHDNLYILPQFQAVIRSGNIYFNNLHTIPIDRTHYENLHNIDLKNDLFEYYYKIRKINDDVSTATSGYQDIKNAFIQKHILKPDYLINANSMANQLKIMEAFFAKLEEDTVNLMAKVAVRIEYDRPLGTKLMFFCIRTKIIKAGDLKAAETKLNKEIEENKTASQEEIEEVLKKNGLI